MDNARGSERSRRAVSLIEIQLHALAVSVAVVSQAAFSGSLGSDAADSFLTLKSRQLPHDSGSGGNIVKDERQGDSTPVVIASNDIPTRPPLREHDYLRIVISNALLAVWMFMSKHEMGNMRTPEIQFLGHVCNAYF